MIFLKLGGSLITDKTSVEAIRSEVLHRVTTEIADAYTSGAKRLLIGHGSGSFAHIPAAKYNTRGGVVTSEDWWGFAEVSELAQKLNQLILHALKQAGVPAISLQPSASALCTDGHITYYNVETLVRAFEAGLVPVIYGDVAFDEKRGGTIISTEEIMSYLAIALPADLKPEWLILAGETAGVLDGDGQVIPFIHSGNYNDLAHAFGGSRGTDVTGGMASKVGAMLGLASEIHGLSIRIMAGTTPGLVNEIVKDPAKEIGTKITA